jgi:hypothetical protein
MRAEEMLKLVRTKTFKPFRISMSDGEQFEVHYPDLVVVDPELIVLGIPGPKGPDAPVDRIVHLSLDHINTVEFLRTVKGKA